MRDERRLVYHSRSRGSLALSSCDNVFEKGDGNNAAIDAQLKIFFLEPVDKLALLIEDSDTRLHKVCIDPYDVIR